MSPGPRCCASTSWPSAWRRRWWRSCATGCGPSTPPAPPSCSWSSRSTWRCCWPSGRCSWRRARSASGARPPSCSTGPTCSARCSSVRFASPMPMPMPMPTPTPTPAPTRWPPVRYPAGGRASNAAASSGASAASPPLDGVDLDIAPGAAVGIIGHNGAGKTTLFDVISGFLAPDAGEVRLRDVDMTDAPPHRRAVAGLGRSFQEARLFPSLTVAETVAVALERHLPNRDTLAAALALPGLDLHGGGSRRAGDELLTLLGLTGYRNHRIADLSTGTRRIVELACVLAQDPAVLLLDEPSAGVAQRETEALGPLLRRVRAATGCSLVIIEHDMGLLSAVCDELVALEFGSVIARGTPAEVLAHPRVISSYLGPTRTRQTVGSRLLRHGGGRLTPWLNAPHPARQTRLTRQESQARTRMLLLEVAADGVPGPRLHRHVAGAGGRDGRLLQGRGLRQLRRQGRAVPGRTREPLLRPAAAVRGGVRRPAATPSRSAWPCSSAGGRSCWPTRSGSCWPWSSPSRPGATRRSWPSWPSGRRWCGWPSPPCCRSRSTSSASRPVLPPDQLAIVLVAVVGGIAVQRLVDPTIPASLMTDAVRALFRAPKPEGG